MSELEQFAQSQLQLLLNTLSAYPDMKKDSRVPTVIKDYINVNEPVLPGIKLKSALKKRVQFS